VDKLGTFLIGLARATREGIVAKEISRYAAKRALREKGYMPEPKKKAAKKAK